MTQFSRSPQVKKLLNKLEKFANPQQVSFNELFTPDFMSVHTQFPNFDSMMEASGFNVQSSEDFLAILDVAWDKFIGETTKFSNWKEMQEKAAAELIKKKINIT